MKPTIPAHPLPMIHSNGTGAASLLADYRAAWDACRLAREALAKVEFNARDYYVLHPGAWTEAREAREVAFRMLDAVAEHCMAHAMHASDALPD
jgi:hypothetical protein